MIQIEHVVEWLKETDEKIAAAILEECQINSMFVDTLFAISSDLECEAYDVQIKVPGKYFKNLDEKYSEEKKSIERAIIKVGDAEMIGIQHISWTLKLGNEWGASAQSRHEQIIKHLDAEYVRQQIKIMQSSVLTAPHLAIGLAKELVETCCKTILKDKNVEIDKNWDLGKLVKETNKNLRLIPSFIEDKEKAKQAVEKLLGGFSTVVQGITELRNAFGTGHGHDSTFRSLDEIYARLVTGAASEFAIFYLEIYNREADSDESGIF